MTHYIWQILIEAEGKNLEAGRVEYTAESYDHTEAHALGELKRQQAAAGLAYGVDVQAGVFTVLGVDVPLIQNPHVKAQLVQKQVVNGI